MGENMNTVSSADAAVLDEYESWLRSWASRSTIRARRTLIANRLAAWGVSGFTAPNIAEFLASDDLDSAWSRSTYHNHFTCFCAWLVATKRLKEDPMPLVRKAKPPRGTPRPLTDSEVTAVLSDAQGDVRAWLLLALLVGLRAHEVAKIRGEDITSDGVRVRGKGDVTVTLPCHPDIARLAEGYPAKGYWFSGSDQGHVRSTAISLKVGRHFTSHGVAGSIHRLRHTYGTRLLRRGVNIRVVQKLMRHASLATTATYTAVDEDEMRDAIFRLPAA